MTAPHPKGDNMTNDQLPNEYPLRLNESIDIRGCYFKTLSVDHRNRAILEPVSDINRSRVQAIFRKREVLIIKEGQFRVIGIRKNGTVLLKLLHHIRKVSPIIPGEPCP